MKRKLKQISIDAESLNGLRYPSIESGLSVQKYIQLVLDVLGTNRKMQLEFKKFLQENGFEFIGKSLSEIETKLEENEIKTIGKTLSKSVENECKSGVIIGSDIVNSEIFVESIIEDRMMKEMAKEKETYHLDIKEVGSKVSKPISKDKIKVSDGNAPAAYDIDGGGVPLLEVEGVKGVPKNGYVKRSGKVFINYENKIYKGDLADRYKIGGKVIEIDSGLIGSYKSL